MSAMRTRPALPRPVDQFVKNTQQNISLLLLGGLFILGAFCGSSLYRSISAETSHLLMLLLSGGTADGSFHFWADFGAVLGTNLMVVALLFLCGFCAISQPVILLVPFVKGLGFGLVAAYNTVLFSPYSAFFWLKFLPGAFFATALILLCARQSLLLSVNVYQSVFTPPSKVRLQPTLYMAKYLCFCLLCVIFSLLDALFDLAYAVISSPV